jgi:hypothetical protein
MAARKTRSAPTSRFTPTGKTPAGEPEVTAGTLSPAVDTVKEDFYIWKRTPRANVRLNSELLKLKMSGNS